MNGWPELDRELWGSGALPEGKPSHWEQVTVFSGGSFTGDGICSFCCPSIRPSVPLLPGYKGGGGAGCGSVHKRQPDHAGSPR